MTRDLSEQVNLSEDEYDNKIKDIANTTDTETERKKAIRELIRELQERALSQGMSEEDWKNKTRKGHIIYIKEFLKKIPTEEREKASDSLNILERLQIKEDGKLIQIKELFLSEIPREDIDIGNPSETRIMEAPVRNKLLDSVKDKTEEEQFRFKRNIDNIAEVLATKIRRGKTEVRTVRMNAVKYLGGVNLSKADTRAEIYDFWEETADKYKQFKDDLKSFFDAVLTNDKTKESTKKYFTQLKEEYLNDNLEYIGKFNKITKKLSPQTKRLIARIENLTDFEEIIDNIIDNFDDGNDSEDSFDFSGLNESEMDLINSAFSDIVSHRDEAFIEEIELPDTIEGDIEDNDITENAEIDPLLAYELMQDTKLISITEEGQKQMTQILNEAIEDAITLNMKFAFRKAREELRDSFTIEKDEYYLPISVLNNGKFMKYLEMSYIDKPAELESKIERSSIDTDVERKIGELLDKIHIGITDEEFGFDVSTRTNQGKAATGSIIDERDIPRSQTETPASRVREALTTARGVFNPLTRGKAKEELQDVKQELEKLLQSTNEYYIMPMYSGRLPIYAPSFMTGRGAMALDVLAKDFDLSNVMGEGYEILAQTGGGKLIEAQYLREIADFLEYLQNPNFKITDKLITAANEASDALTQIFGEEMEEVNDNYIGAIMAHFMEELGETEELDEDFNGETFRDRKAMHQRDYQARKPIPMYILPYYLEKNQGILTQDDNTKEAYRRLVDLFQTVEEYTPTVLMRKMLKAHDLIRKQLGKEIEFGFMQINFNNIEKMIERMYGKGVDLSHYEVDNIIKSDDSHQNIAKEYGINSDHVYLIKANFR